MSVVLWGCLLGGISKLRCCCCCCKQVETSLWHLHILSPLPSTSESFVACSKKEKMLHKLHSPRQFQASRHATVDCFPCPFFPLSLYLFLLAGSLSVGKNEAAAKATKRGQQKLSASSSTAPTGGRLCLRLGDLLSLAMRAWAQMKRRQAASAVASARAYL